jgi:hypothetical protein
MLIVALVLAVIGLAALVTAVVTSNELIAWVCIGASVIGVLLLIVDAVRERSREAASDDDDGAERVETVDRTDDTTVLEPVGSAEDYPEDAATEVSESATVAHEQADEPAAESTKHD